MVSSSIKPYVAYDSLNMIIVDTSTLCTDSTPLKENDEIDSQDKIARIDADFVLMTQTMAQFIKELMQHFKVNTDKEW